MLSKVAITCKAKRFTTKYNIVHCNFLQALYLIDDLMGKQISHKDVIIRKIPLAFFSRFTFDADERT